MSYFERKKDLYWDCETCGEKSVQTVEDGKSGWKCIQETDTSITPEIRGFIRHRTCEGCGTKLSTVEIPLADLKELQKNAGDERFFRERQQLQIQELEEIKVLHEQLVTVLKDRNQADERIAKLIAESEAKSCAFFWPSPEVLKELGLT